MSGAPGTASNQILDALFEKYMDERNITVSDEEIARSAASRQRNSLRRLEENEVELRELRASLQNDSLSPQQREKILESIENLERANAIEKEHPTDYQSESFKTVTRRFIRYWKMNQQLYRDYGGRVIFQQMGPEPLDAMREFLKEEQAKGSFSFKDAGIEADFWKYFTTEPPAWTVTTDEKEVHRMMNTPWWEEM